MRALDLRGLEERVTTLTTPDDVDAYLDQHPDCLVFKVGSCRRTDEAWSEVRGPLLERPDLGIALVDVVAARPASRHLAHRTRTEHASPQVIVLRNGEACYAQDNFRISAQSLRDELTHRGPKMETDQGLEERE